MSEHKISEYRIVKRQEFFAINLEYKWYLKVENINLVRFMSCLVQKSFIKYQQCAEHHNRVRDTEITQVFRWPCNG